METISVVLSVFNEEARLARTLAVLLWVDEIIVIDNESTDQTAGIAKKYGATVYKEKNNLMLNINKNKGFIKAKSDWILNLDGDEVVPPELAQEIKTVISRQSSVVSQQVVGYWIPRKNIIFGKWIQHGLWWPDQQVRLFRRGKGKFPCEHIHEYIKVDGPVGQLTQPYIHYNYESVHQYLTKIDRASTSESITLRETNYRTIWYDAIRFPLSDFLKIYFAERAYKDGLHGLVLALLQSFYSFCTFAKLWESEKFSEHEIPVSVVGKELVRAQREVRYWLLSAKIGETHYAIKKIWYRIIRKYAR
ncbi:MAG: glycosyltransferase family 2 protein [Patescibacteria group bacterium]